MIKKALQILVLIFASYYIGFTFGIFMGTIFGAILGLFFREIVYSYQTVIMSFLFALALGGLLGWLAILAERRYHGTKDSPGLGVMLGAASGFLVILGYGVIVISNPQIFDDTFYSIPMSYGAGIGQYIGSIDCVLLCTFLVIRDITQNRPTKSDQQEFDSYSDFFRKKLKK